MNERLEQMMLKAAEDMPHAYYVPPQYWEKFAELIVRECLTKCDEVQTMYGQYTFTARKCKEAIKEHFGVKE